ncbi:MULTISPECIES: DUF2178 domain-containing protein [Vagococcus]|uniref:Uncharacterized protein n=1 Tax=Vagococcus fluvialis bH819 TaxID=1255619 RepID=A0A1X6WN66_9ENTE|nr:MULTISPECIES: DUF2178 domain-containing protein [Vagococcus]SLM85672.1 hypothetical protein FM121_06190 [Vagococcus fluvialis bH819]HCM89639.1 DUF2178 domain-containing protein [Vagococcus sp.]
MSQLIMLIFIVSLGVAYFYNLFYRSKKQMEYGNDERWSLIKEKASQISLKYYQFLIVVIAILMTLILFIPQMDISFSLNRGLMIAFDLIIIGQLVEMFALKNFDKKM